METPPAHPPPHPPPQLPSKRDNHTPSCAVCQRRKVKCDRVYPCAACTKSGLECAFPPVRPAKRPRKNAAHPHSLSHVDRPLPPALIKKPSAHDFPSPESNQSVGTSAGTGTARLLSEGAGYRYVNNHLWTAIPTESDTAAESPSPSSTNDGSRSPRAPRPGHAIYEDAVRGGDEMGGAGRSFVFSSGHASSRLSAASAQMPADRVVFLWQTYLSNVDPVMKISHAPTVQQILLGQIGKPDVPRNEKALMSAIYLISVVSLTDEQCQESLREPRVDLLQRHREYTEQALSAASFITSTDTMVLQALILYLAALRSLGEVQTVWAMFGLAIRIAGTIGLPRDGTAFGLPPFDVELRRRLWWGIVYFDGRMSELVGQDGDLMGNDYETLSPANLNDSDLFPTMSRLPESRKGPTDAVYLHARFLSVTVARNLQSITGPQGTWHRLQEATMSTAEKLEVMRKIEQRYELEILALCDPTVPLQWISINTARTFATKLRLIARIPIVDLDKDWEDTTGYSENAFMLSMELLQLQLDLWREPMVQQWRWHWQVHFQWYALVCLLKQVRLRRSDHGISRAWTLIQQVFDIIIPTLVVLGPRRSHLLDGINHLLNAAKRQKEEPVAYFGEKQILSGQGSPVAAPSVGLVKGFSTGHGARPHSALLPGMDSVQAPAASPFGGRNPLDELNNPTLGFDLDAIDWIELDRLASELCQ